MTLLRSESGTGCRCQFFRDEGTQRDEKQKTRSGFPERVSLNLAPLTGIAFANNWLISKLILKALPVKTTRMTTKINEGI